ncbi:MAG: 4'-phosphopantetheinyl transferase superfamily protein [Bacillota bacterium]|nr:4'-phosphopantetheinyl transferase superfamily protein [Bacillota bacterium]
MFSIYVLKIPYDTDGQAVLQKLAPFISKRARAANPRVKLMSVCGEALARHALFEKYKIPTDTEFLYSDNGKPYLDCDDYFNISHSGELAVCAVGDKKVGIDVERLRTADMALARRFFCESEIKYLDRLDGTEKNSEFTRIWTMKESYVKCSGMSIGSMLSKVAVDTKNMSAYDLSGEKLPYHFYPYTFENYFLTICEKTLDFDVASTCML